MKFSLLRCPDCETKTLECNYNALDDGSVYIDIACSKCGCLWERMGQTIQEVKWDE